MQYYVVEDLTKEPEDSKSSLYFSTYDNDNILRNVLMFKEQNKTNIEDLRLYRFKTEKEYKKSYSAWIGQIKFWQNATHKNKWKYFQYG